jgi:hypothetical protein
MTTQVSPFPTGTVLNADQGGTGLDMTGIPAGNYLTTTGNSTAPFQVSSIPAAPAAKQFAVFSDQHANGVAAVAGNSSSFNRRVINTTLVNTIVGCSLAGNDITLPAGTYHISASAVSCYYAQTKIDIVSDISELNLISGVSVAGVGATSLVGSVEGVITLAVPTPIFINQWLGLAVAGGTSTMGNPTTGTGEPETYAQITIIQI